MSQPKKPRIVIEATGAENRPYRFCVKWKDRPWKNSQWFTFDEALVAAGVKSLHSLRAMSDLFQGWHTGGEVAPGMAVYVGERGTEAIPFQKVHHVHT